MHCQVCVAGVKKVEEFAAWQLADAFQDGIEFGYFHEDQCRRAFWFGELSVTVFDVTGTDNI